MNLLLFVFVVLLILGLDTFVYAAIHFREQGKAKKGFFVSGLLFFAPIAICFGVFSVNTFHGISFSNEYLAFLAVIVFEIILVIVMLITRFRPSQDRTPRNVIMGIAIFELLQIVGLILVLFWTSNVPPFL